MKLDLKVTATSYSLVKLPRYVETFITAVNHDIKY